MKKFLVLSSLLILYSSLYFMLKIPSTKPLPKTTTAPKKKVKVNRCKAKLRNGKRCTRKPDEGSDFCWQHT